MKYSKWMRGLAALALTAAGSLAAAQPAGVVRVLVGFPAGGAPDAVARLFAEHLRQSAGLNVVVENRPGASGKLAIDAALVAPADGQVVAVVPSSQLLLSPMVLKAANYGPLRDFTPIAALAEIGFGVAFGPAVPSRSIREFAQWAQAHPAKADFATPGLGTPQHFLGVELGKLLGAPLTHVPYRGGAPAVTDVLGGQVGALITTEQLLVPYHAQGKLRAVLVTSPKRNAKLPDVPTARESGLAQLEAVDWFGLFVKAGIAAEPLAQWKRWAAAVQERPAYRQAIAELGYSLAAQPVSGLEERLAADRRAWGERVRVSGFTATE